MKPDCTPHQRAILDGVGTTTDSQHCDDCRSLFSIERALADARAFHTTEPPSSLVTGTLERISSHLENRVRERQRITRYLVLAGAFSLPVIMLINAVLLSVVYAVLARWLPDVAATTATAFVASSLLMGVSLAYAALPLLASFGFRLRESF